MLLIRPADREAAGAIDCTGDIQRRQCQRLCCGGPCGKSELHHPGAECATREGEDDSSSRRRLLARSDSDAHLAARHERDGTRQRGREREHGLCKHRDPAAGRVVMRRIRAARSIGARQRHLPAYCWGLEQERLARRREEGEECSVGRGAIGATDADVDSTAGGRLAWRQRDDPALFGVGGAGSIVAEGGSRKNTEHFGRGRDVGLEVSATGAVSDGDVGSGGAGSRVM